MEQALLPLNRLPMGRRAKVLSLALHGPVRHRMLDLGMVEGTEIAPLFASPAGNPVAYSLRGAVIALRADIASGILVKEC